VSDSRIEKWGTIVALRGTIVALIGGVLGIVSWVIELPQKLGWIETKSPPPIESTTIPNQSLEQILAGTIYDAEDNQPLANVRVTLPAFKNATAQTNMVGRFELHVTAPTETDVELIAQKDGYIADPRYAPLGDQGYNFTMQRQP